MNGWIRLSNWLANTMKMKMNATPIAMPIAAAVSFMSRAWPSSVMKYPSGSGALASSA